MATIITEEIKSKAEFHEGNDICLARSRELLKEIGLPNGLLPLEDVIECGHVRETGFVWMKQKKKTVHEFKKIGKLVSYETFVTAYVEKNKIKKLTGVKTKELLVWVNLSDIYVDDPPTGKITFKAMMGLSRTFPVTAFEVEENEEEKKEVKNIDEAVKEVVVKEV